MNQYLKRKVFPGQKLSKYDQQNLGYGLYVEKDIIYASAIGVVKKNQQGRYQIENNFEHKCIGPKVGDIVYGQITKIKEDEAFVSIIQINEASISKAIEATIRKEHVREKLIDQVIIIESYRPNDIIKAKIISMGDSSRNLYLTTAAEELGVLVAKNQNSNLLMLPYDWTTMVDINNADYEKRKVAKPEN